MEPPPPPANNQQESNSRPEHGYNPWFGFVAWLVVTLAANVWNIHTRQEERRELQEIKAMMAERRGRNE